MKRPFKKNSNFDSYNINRISFKEMKKILIWELKELDKLTREFFDTDGFLSLSRNPSDLVFYKIFYILQRSNKDSQKYIPEFLEDIIEKIKLYLFCQNT